MTRLLWMLVVAVLARAAEWPQFRGPAAAGIAEDLRLPDSWDVEKGTNIRWKAAIPGLAHASPIVWGDKIFLATAVSSRTDATFSGACTEMAPHRTTTRSTNGSSFVSTAKPERRCGRKLPTKGRRERSAISSPPTPVRHRPPMAKSSWPFSARRESTPSTSMGSCSGSGTSGGSTPAPMTRRITSGAPQARQSSTRARSFYSAISRRTRSSLRWMPPRAGLAGEPDATRSLPGRRPAFILLALGRNSSPTPRT